MKYVLISGSLRRDSLNKRLCRYIAESQSSNLSAEMKFIDLQALQIPIYDGDIETQSGLPKGVTELAHEIAAADALIVSSPEYNGSIAGPLKNTLDWLSRTKPHPIAQKPILLMSASPGALGGVRGLWHTRVPFEALGGLVYAEMVGIPKAHEVLTLEGQMSDEKLRLNLERVLAAFNLFVLKLSRAL